MNVENFYEEHLTDKIIRKEYFPEYDYKGIIVEVGAATPSFLSFTKHFRDNGWRAVHIEPNPYFVNKHQLEGTEIYEYACSNEDKDNVNFTVVTVQESDKETAITNHSFSSLSVKEEYINLHGDYFQRLQKKTIKVKVRKLDTILDELKINHVDILTVDTEGWELEVMEGLTVVRPTIVVLENITYSEKYNDFMEKKNYSFLQKNEFNYIYKNNEAKIDIFR